MCISGYNTFSSCSSIRQSLGNFIFLFLLWRTTTKHGCFGRLIQTGVHPTDHHLSPNSYLHCLNLDSECFCLKFSTISWTFSSRSCFFFPEPFSFQSFPLLDSIGSQSEATRSYTSQRSNTAKEDLAISLKQYNSVEHLRVKHYLRLNKYIM